MIGRLFYLTATRSDIILSVWICAQFQSCPRTSHFNSHDKKLQILKGTIDLGLRYPKNISFHFLGYSNIVFAGCLTERKSTSGTCYFLVILQYQRVAKKQNSVTHSIDEQMLDNFRLILKMYLQVYDNINDIMTFV